MKYAIAAIKMQLLTSIVIEIYIPIPFEHYSYTFIGFQTISKDILCNWIKLSWFDTLKFPFSDNITIHVFSILCDSILYFCVELYTIIINYNWSTKKLSAISDY